MGEQERTYWTSTRVVVTALVVVVLVAAGLVVWQAAEDDGAQEGRDRVDCVVDAIEQGGDAGDC